MLALGLQTLLLMCAAYCLGAALACFVRRLFFSRGARQPQTIERRVEPLQEADPGVIGRERFQRTAKAPVAPAKTAPVAPAKTAPVAPAETAPVAPAETAPVAPAKAAPVAPVRVEPVAAATAAPVRIRTPAPVTAPAAGPVPKPAPVKPEAPAPADDLERIHAVDAVLAAGLHRLNIRHYHQIGRWQRADLERVAQALAIRRSRISRENWIEQAQILAAGVETYYARRRALGEIASAVPTASARDRQGRGAAPSPPPAAAPRSRRDEVAPLIAPALMAANPLAASAPLAAPPAVAAPAFAPAGVSERAAFARRVAPVRPATAAAAAPPTAEPASPPPAAAAAPVPLAPAKPIRPEPPAACDTFERIRGITATVAEHLRWAGVTRYAEIAAWSAADVDRFDRELGRHGRIARDNWIEQAQILSKGGDTAFSRAFDRRPPEAPLPAPAPAKPRPRASAAPGPQPRPGLLGALRSVRSQAYQNPEPGPEAAHRAGWHNRVVRSTPPQDLKRIRGIGVLIEKRLNAMHIATYEQIANWTAEDIERVSRTLDFKGRIERENWVEQARILASGGATEFSRRVDRGDVETGRYRP